MNPRSIAKTFFLDILKIPEKDGLLFTAPPFWFLKTRDILQAMEYSGDIVTFNAQPNKKE